MSNYSKEYIEKYDNGGLPYDFSVIEIFKKLKPGQCRYEICEGFGFHSIGNIDGECYVAFTNYTVPEEEDDSTVWLKFSEIDDRTYDTAFSIKFNSAEIQSGVNRVNWAEGLILQLPKTHEGRNSWLLNYGVSEEAVALRKKHKTEFDIKTQSCKLKK